MNIGDMLPDYLDEARKMVSGLAEVSYGLEENPDCLKEAMRLFHTLKGSSGFMGFDSVCEFCHLAEEAISGMKEVPEGFPQFLRAVSAALSEIVDGIESSGAELPSVREALAPFSRGFAGADFTGVTGQARSVLDETGLRLSAERLDTMLSLIGQVEVLKNRLASQTHRLPTDVVRAFHDLELNLDALRDQVMGLRMVDMGRYFRGLRAVVSEMADQMGKEVDFQTTGGEVRVDRVVAEGIMEALTHLLRNALDHGVESPDERESAGKARAGMVTLAISQEGNRVLITVSDDGRGVNMDRLRARALEDFGRDMTRAELLSLLFRHGFSLTKETTRYSGRGVGLDVVKEAVDRLGGSVSLDTAEGRGMTVTLDLPLTVLVTRLCFVRIGNEVFGLPLSSVARVDWRDDLEVVSPAGRQFVKTEERALALVDAGRVLGLSSDGEMILTLRSGTEDFCLAVDEVLPESDAVVKPLGEMFSGQKQFVGSVIGADGVPVLVMDPGYLVDQGGENA